MHEWQAGLALANSGECEIEKRHADVGMELLQGGKAEKQEQSKYCTRKGNLGAPHL